MFDRTLKIMTQESLDKIKEQKILLVGVGGVGGFALEALLRMGFSNITIVDSDCFEESNLNRQILCTRKTIGKSKTEVAKQRALEINPSARITTHPIFLTEENLEEVFKESYDYILDACDTITTKVLLIKKAHERGIKIISCMGTGNRFEPSKVTITSLDKTHNDPLAKAMRTILRKENLSFKVPVVWSSELPVKIKEATPGSIVLVPAAAGLQMVFFILKDLETKI